MVRRTLDDPGLKGQHHTILEVAPMASGKLILLALLGLVVAEGSVFLAAAQTFGLPLFCLRCSQLLGIWSLAAAWAKLPSSSGHVVAARICDRGNRLEPSGRVLDLDRREWRHP